MKKLLLLVCALTLVLTLTTPILAADKNQAKQNCTTIQDAVLRTSAGDFIHPGYDEWGYNYQAMMFNGKYCNYDRNPVDCPDENSELIMKWNEAWLSNKDCDGDGKLDRHYGFPTYKGSGAWTTNHQSGTYVGAEGKECKWVYFCKIVAVPADATITSGIWHDADGNVIGPSIWGEFAIIQEIYNDPCGGYKGKLYLSPVGPGFGKFKPEN